MDVVQEHQKATERTVSWNTMVAVVRRYRKYDSTNNTKQSGCPREITPCNTLINKPISASDLTQRLFMKMNVSLVAQRISHELKPTDRVQEGNTNTTNTGWKDDSQSPEAVFQRDNDPKHTAKWPEQKVENRPGGSNLPSKIKVGV